MDILSYISDIIWGLPTVMLILGMGLALSFKLRLPQIFRFNEMLGSLRGLRENSAESPLRAVSTALAATIGTGSVVGVGSAIMIGGAGAIFWLWVSAFFGMAVAYAEGVLSIKYRRKDRREGGMWYAVRDGAGLKNTAKLYAAFTAFAAFGMGCMAQISSAAAALNSGFSLSPTAVGIGCFILLLACLFGRDLTGRLCEIAMPFFAGFYVVGALAVIIKNYTSLPEVMRDISAGAFGLRPFAGGTVGYTMARAVSVGCRRGVFSNEAGLGTTAPIHAASNIDDPDRQGLMNMLEVTVDTFLICTLTAFAILCSGADKLICRDGAETVLRAAESTFGPAAGKLVALSVAVFSIATAVGWSKIGLSAAEFLCPKSGAAYKAVYSLSALLGSFMTLEGVLKLSDIFNGMMVFPCMAAIIILRKDIYSAPPK